MARQQRIVLSEETGKLPLPKDIQAIANDAVQALWQVAYATALAELDQKRQEYQRQVAQLEEQQQAALKTHEGMAQEFTNLKRESESLSREYKVLRHDLESKSIQLQVNHSQLVELNEKSHGQEQEIRRLQEELGRGREALESCQRRFENAQNQCQQDNKAVRKLEEELAVQGRYRERLESNLRSLHTELDQQQEKVKAENLKTAQIEGSMRELRELLKKNEQEHLSVKAESYEVREKLDTEVRLRGDVEKKAAGFQGQLEALEGTYQSQIQKLEQELQASKAEVTSLRTRMIKAESGLEREMKRSERLEAKLIGNNSGR